MDDATLERVRAAQRAIVRRAMYRRDYLLMVKQRKLVLIWRAIARRHLNRPLRVVIANYHAAFDETDDYEI